MRPTVFFANPPKGAGRQVYVVSYGYMHDRRRVFADTKKEAQRIGAELIAKGEHVTDHPVTWPDVHPFDADKVRPWVNGKRYIANGVETIYERP